MTEPDSKPATAESLRNSLFYVIREYAESLIIAIAIALILRIFVFSAYRIPGEAMYPSLLSGDFIIGYKVPYGLRLPFIEMKKWGEIKARRGDLVVFKCPLRTERYCVKRLIGLPGDRIEIGQQRLKLNGQSATYHSLPPQSGRHLLVQEKLSGLSYNISLNLGNPQANNFGPYIVPPDHFFALSDNRSQMADSRTWGAVSLSHLEARVLIIWLSFDWGLPGATKSWPEVRWARLFMQPN